MQQPQYTQYSSIARVEQDPDGCVICWISKILWENIVFSYCLWVISLIIYIFCFSGLQLVCVTSKKKRKQLEVLFLTIYIYFYVLFLVFNNKINFYFINKSRVNYTDTKLFNRAKR
jgi:hypothetical protein